MAVDYKYQHNADGRASATGAERKSKMTTAWNELNTAGFSQDELATLSNAQERLTGEFPDIDESNLNDLLNNEWQHGITENDLVDAVTKRLS